MDVNDPDFLKNCCSRCPYKLYSVLDSKGGTICRFFWQKEDCEYYRVSREFMKPFCEMLERVERVNRAREDLNGLGSL